MSGVELFIYLLLGFGWIVFQVFQRVLRKPRPLGKVQDEAGAEPSPRGGRIDGAAQPSPLDTAWGRVPVPVPRPVEERVDIPLPVAVQELPSRRAAEPFTWSRDAAQDELRIAREVARRQAAARLAAQLERAPRRHPHRPRLRTHGELRKAVVLAALIGPCRAMEPWQPPDGPA